MSPELGTCSDCGAKAEYRLLEGSTEDKKPRCCGCYERYMRHAASARANGIRLEPGFHFVPPEEQQQSP